MIRIHLFFISLLLSLGLMAQDVLPTVGQAAADQYIVLLAQQGWRPEGASLSYDEQTLYLSLRKAPKEDYDLYCCHYVDGRWQQPVRLDFLSTDDNEWSPSVSPDECSLFFIREEITDRGTRKQKTRHMLYFSERTAGENWPDAQWMLLSNGDDSHPRMLQDGQILLFTSLGREENERRPQPHRYFVQRMDKYNWTLPQLLPDGAVEDSLAKPIRRVEGQVSDVRLSRPMKANVQVYDVLTGRCVQVAASDAKGAFTLMLPYEGAYRIEISKPGYSKAYISPTEAPVQQVSAQLTPELAIHLDIYDDETMAHLRPALEVIDVEVGKPASVRRQQNQSGTWHVQLPIDHFYQLRLSCPAYADTTFLFDTRKDVLLPEASLDLTMRVGHVLSSVSLTDWETGEPVDSGHVSVRNLESEETVPFLSPMRLRCGTRYVVEASAPGYFFCDSVVTTPLREGEFPLQLALHRMRLSDVVQLRNIRFEFNSYVLLEESYSELHRVAELLRDNPSVKIELSAHTDDVGSAEYNLRLSDRRGHAVRDYLVETEHIDPSQIISKGYGKSRPLVPNDTDEHRAMNRRVEFSILEL